MAAPTVYRKGSASLTMASPEHLTARENDVLNLLAEGCSNKEIAHQLTIAEKTVKTHVSNILAKLGLPSRTQAALYAVRSGIVPEQQGDVDL